MGVDSCHVFVWQNTTSGYFYSDPIFRSCLLSLLQTKSFLTAHIFFILKPFFVGPQALMLPLGSRFSTLCNIRHKSEKITPGVEPFPRLSPWILSHSRKRSQWHSFLFIKPVGCFYFLYQLLLFSTLSLVASFFICKVFCKVPGQESVT